MAVFDIHVVSHHVSDRTVERLIAAGFGEERVLGGDDRVRMQRLMSMKFDNVNHADSKFQDTVALLREDSSFVGYIEEEITTAKERVDGRPTPGPIGPFPSVDARFPPAGVLKTCDIHASGSSIFPELEAALRDAGLYFIVLDKAGVGPVTVFTIQTEELSTGREFHQQLLTYLRDSGGFSGFVKFEVLRNLENFDSRLPPIVRATTS